MDTSTSYLGLRLAHPSIVGASPMTADLDAVRQLEDGGCAALVMHSLFEEQITMADRGEILHRDPLDPEFTAALANFPAPADYHFQPSGHLEHLHRVKQAVKVPVIGSLNGTTSEGWLRYARLLQEAGADAIEVNLYGVMADLDTPGLAVETGVRDLVIELKRSLRIPLAVKLSTFFSAFGNFARGSRQSSRGPASSRRSADRRIRLPHRGI